MNGSEDADEAGTLLRECAERLFGSFGSRPLGAGTFDQDWSKVEEAGFPLALIRESAGGFGIDAAVALGLLRVAGRHAVRLPLAETMIANRMLTDAGFDAAEGIATVATEVDGLSLERSATAWRVKGRSAAVHWARHARVVVAALRQGDVTYLVRLGGPRITEGTTIAGLPSDSIDIDAELSDGDVREISPDWNSLATKAACAAARVMQMAGALDRILEMTVGYASERIQFGKPIGKQQAVQQQLAVLAGQAAACGVASDIAARAIESFDLSAIAAAKVRAGEAVGLAATISHQVHGAIGFTQEHRLHLYTRLVWAWRDEFGSERFWSGLLGERSVASGPTGLWPFIVSVGSEGRAQ